jgi:hypothetical protein
MTLFTFYGLLFFSSIALLTAALPAESRDIPVVVEFNASCWDMQTFDGPKASRTDILKLADQIARRTECILTKPDDGYLYMKDLGAVGDAGARLLWTQETLNKGLRNVGYPW